MSFYSLKRTYTKVDQDTPLLVRLVNLLFFWPMYSRSHIAYRSIFYADHESDLGLHASLKNRFEFFNKSILCAHFVYIKESRDLAQKIKIILFRNKLVKIICS